MASVIDLFAGCGGMTEGFRVSGLGFEPVAAVEWELAAAATYAVNFGESHTYWEDIADFEVPGRADVVIGGPPCQGFSNLGSKDVNDPRNKLWKEYMRVVLEANPQVFVLENVERFSKSTEFALLMDELAGGRLRKWTHFDTAVLNAADFGVPQRRHRTIVIASRVGPISLPKPTHSRNGADGRPPWRTVRDAIADLPAMPSTTEIPNTYVELLGEVVPGVFKPNQIHFGRNPSQRSLDRYDHVPPGGGRFNLPDRLLPDCWRNKPTGTTDVMGRMRWDMPSLTIRTEFFKPEKGQYLHPQWDEDDAGSRVNRVITHHEAARLQTFPDDFVWCGTKTEIARQIGNAVPPRLAEAVAREVFARLK